MLKINNITNLKQILRQVNFLTSSQIKNEYANLCIVKTYTNHIYFMLYNKQYHGCASVSESELYRSDEKVDPDYQSEYYWFNLQDFNLFCKQLKSNDELTIQSKNIRGNMFLNQIQVKNKATVVMFASLPEKEDQISFDILLRPNISDFNSVIANINKSVKKTFLDLSNFIVFSVTPTDSIFSLDMFSFNNQNIYHGQLTVSGIDLTDQKSGRRNYLIDKNNVTKMINFLSRNKDKSDMKLLFSDSQIRIEINNEMNNDQSYIDLFLQDQDSNVADNISYLNLYSDKKNFEEDKDAQFDYSDFLKKKDAVKFEAENLPVFKSRDEDIYKVRKRLFSGWIDLVELKEKQDKWKRRGGAVARPCSGQ